MMKLRTNVYIDASNLFYGGQRSLGWKIDYKKLLEYFYTKYEASRVFFFGGVETHNYPFDYLGDHSISVFQLEKYLTSRSHKLDRVRFYLKLETFGYTLVLKPVKTFIDSNGSTVRKANCDVDMAFSMIADQDMFDRVLVLSGDGDFLPALKYLRANGKEVLILARASRTAREIRKFAGGKFLDFEYLREILKYSDG